MPPLWYLLVRLPTTCASGIPTDSCRAVSSPPFVTGSAWTSAPTSKCGANAIAAAPSKPSTSMSTTSCRSSNRASPGAPPRVLALGDELLDSSVQEPKLLTMPMAHDDSRGFLVPSGERGSGVAAGSAEEKEKEEEEEEEEPCPDSSQRRSWGFSNK